MKFTPNWTYTNFVCLGMLLEIHHRKRPTQRLKASQRERLTWPWPLFRRISSLFVVIITFYPLSYPWNVSRQSRTRGLETAWKWRQLEETSTRNSRWKTCTKEEMGYAKHSFTTNFVCSQDNLLDVGATYMQIRPNPGGKLRTLKLPPKKWINRHRLRLTMSKDYTNCWIKFGTMAQDYPY